MGVSKQNYANAFWIRRIIQNKEGDESANKVEIVMLSSRIPQIINSDEINFLPGDAPRELRLKDFVIFSKGKYYLIVK